MSSSPTPEPRERGLLAWMVYNRVTPNLAMVVLLLGGLFMTTRIKQEVFPDFDLDMVQVRVLYPGASPEEVEQGIVLAIEEGVRGLDGIKEVQSTSGEGMGMVLVELLTGADGNQAYQDIRQAVDRITTFPKDAERPEVSEVLRRRQVISLVLHGPVSEGTLRELAEQTRDRLLQEEGITQVDLMGARAQQVHVEISERNLRAHGLTLEGVARRIEAASVELPGGKLETSAGEILLRVKDRRLWAREFARVPIVTAPSGATLYLEDVATVREGFEDVPRFATYNGQSAVLLEIYRVGEQTPIGVSDAARSVMEAVGAELPPAVGWTITADRSDIYRQRLELLLKNAFFGLVLVLVLLGLFLELRLAFWVTMGIPTSFLGGLLFMPLMGVSINMISMFAFIIALGIVVDDAIVAGENIYEYRSRGMSFTAAAIRGARDVSVPIAFSILTNVVAFMPLAVQPGFIGKIWRVIPAVVITVFLISWAEALLILPAHLAHTKRRRPGAKPDISERWRNAVNGLLQAFLRRLYAPALALLLRWRLLTVAGGIAVLLGVLGLVAGGRVAFILMPRVESDIAVASAALPYGSPQASVAAVRERLEASLRQVGVDHGGDQPLVEGVFSLVEENKVEVTAYLPEVKRRPLQTSALTNRWRSVTGTIPGLQSLRFEADRGGPGAGAALTVELSHRDIGMLDRASEALAAQLREFPNVKDVDDGYTPGKRQLDFKLLPEGQSLGLTGADVARQVRSAFYGAQAVRQQRDRSEVRVLVRRPEEERSSEYDIEQLLIRTPAGRQVPLRQVAQVTKGRAYTAITRRNGRRTVTVTGDVDPIGETSQVKAALDARLLPALTKDYPGLTAGYEGRQAEMREVMAALGVGFLMALGAIYFLLAIPFRSYSQPLIVMMAIPFGVVGAVLGHIVMGYNLSIISMMGVVALAGVVVNDSLVLIDYANRLRDEGATPYEAVTQAGVRRFRPILLTTLTTFGGLAPMIFETSRQARFLIPMALSLGYGILFATGITLLLVPCLYLLNVDVQRFVRRLRGGAAT